MRQKKEKRTGNYEIMAEDNRRRFLTYDQEAIIRKFDLDADKESIRFHLLGMPAVLDRASGKLTVNGEPASINASMGTYDMLAYSKTRPALSGEWVSLEKIGGIIATGHVQNLQNKGTYDKFAGRTVELRKACEDLGGKPGGAGDVCYILPLFDWFPICFRFYDADEDFPASVTWLWDANSTDFLHYECMWYLMGFVEEELEKRI
ncbi:MAG: DUF3786 domain-containing protein [Eubacterium sp.]|nr:DUF3786 domain-containing protein [Eubacterium sp.]